MPITAGILALLIAFAGIYHKQNFVALTDRESADIGQIARNIHADKGFTTRFLRPFNVELVEVLDDTAPEINHAPLFPYAAAAVFRAKHAWSDQGVAWVSLGFFCLTIVATFLLGRALFGWRVGLLAAALVGTSAPALQAAISGQEWTMAAFWMVLLLIVIARHHDSSQKAAGLRQMGWPVAAGLLCAVLYMTNHLLLFLVIPLALYFGLTGPGRRIHLLLFLIVAVLAVAPWAYRNAHLTHGSVLGANAWDLMKDTLAFPGDTFARSTAGADRGVAALLWFPLERFPSFAQKLVSGSAGVLGAMSSMLGLVVLGFAAVSMLYRFKVPKANATRGFAYVFVPLLTAVFALFSAQKHCVVLFLPVAAVFASAYFFLLLDAKSLHIVYSRTLVAGLVLINAWTAVGEVVWPDRPTAPRAVDDANLFFARAAQSSEIVYTDVPWLAAWRTNGTAVWLPRADADVETLASEGLPLRFVCLTRESEDYPRDEAWYLIYRWGVWREYIKDPNACVEQLGAKVEAESRRRLQMENAGKAAFEDLAITSRANAKFVMDRRRRACVIFSSLLGLQELSRSGIYEMPWPAPDDRSGTPNDANAISSRIILFTMPQDDR